jgi:energy-coupling factor transport system ATP-binding protein
MTGSSWRRPVLAARDVSGAPPGVAVPTLEHLTRDFEAGSWLGVTGPNGAGKSTLALTLAGLWPVRTGAIERGAGRDGGPEARVVVILQEPATQITQRSVREEIAFTALNLGFAPERVESATAHWANRFGLAGMLERVPHELSAGQQQRVLLAAALAASPDVLIADEAAAHLDSAGRSLTLEILKEQVAGGLALVWVTQEPAELAWADRVLTIGADGVLPESVTVMGGEQRAESGSIPLAPLAPAPPSSTPLPAANAIHLLAPTLEVEPRMRVKIAASGSESFRVRCQDPIEIAIGQTGVWAVTGPNGSGKTSLLEAIAGVEPLPEVAFEWALEPEPGPMLVGQYPERQIFEERVKAELMFAAVRRGRPLLEAEADALAFLTALGLGAPFFDRRTWSLSAGEKRLVSLIGALIAPAPLLLLDEPTCGLDPSRRRQVAGWVREVSRRLPVIVATQDRMWIQDVGAIEVSLGLTVTSLQGTIR